MNKYRIIEERGKYIKCENSDRECPYCDNNGNKYIPRFVVQEYKRNPELDKNEDCVMFQLRHGIVHQEGIIFGIHIYIYNNLKVFNDLDEARSYKRSLELEDGIVIE